MARGNNGLSPAEFILKGVLAFQKGEHKGVIATFSEKGGVSLKEAFEAHFNGKHDFRKEVEKLEKSGKLVTFGRRARNGVGYVVLYLKGQEPNREVDKQERVKTTLAKILA